MIYVLCVLLGLVAGIVTKGIHIHIHKEDTAKNEGYNESLAPLLPPEVQNYYNNTNGQNNF